MCLFNSSCSPQQVFSPIVMCVGVNGCNVRPDYTYTSCQSKGKRNWKDIKFLVNVPPQKNSLIVWFLVLYMRVKLLGKKGSSELKFKCRQKKKNMEWQYIWWCPKMTLSFAYLFNRCTYFFFCFSNHQTRVEEKQHNILRNRGQKCWP